MGEVEAVFGIWLVPLFLAIIAFHGWSTMVEYVGNVSVSDAIFVVVIMAIAGSLPIIRFTETAITKVSAIAGGTPASWWLAILTLGPLLGSVITGPAAMTICAVLLRHRFYSLKPPVSLKYATLGLLFVNISVGGVLTQFASPPVVIVARLWNWNLVYMLAHFGWKAVIGIISSNLLYLAFFRKSSRNLRVTIPTKTKTRAVQFHGGSRGSISSFSAGRWRTPTIRFSARVALYLNEIRLCWNPEI